MSILVAEHIKKYYGENETLVKALDDVSLSVERGEFVSIIGTSGSGKSTLLHMLGGLDNPTAGISCSPICATRLSYLPPPQTVSFPSFVSVLKALHNVTFGSLLPRHRKRNVSSNFLGSR